MLQRVREKPIHCEHSGIPGCEGRRGMELGDILLELLMTSRPRGFGSSSKAIFSADYFVSVAEM